MGINPQAERVALEASRDLFLSLLRSTSQRELARRISREVCEALDHLGGSEEELAQVVLQPQAPSKEARPEQAKGPGSSPPAGVTTRRRETRKRDLDLLLRRVSLKQAAAELGARMLGCGTVGTPSEKEEQEARHLIGEARCLAECYLWPLDARELGLCREDYELAARVYANLGRAGRLARLWEELGDNRPPEQGLLNLLAEAQSALRVLLERLGVRRDRDQIQLWIWVREMGRDHHIFVARFMRQDDPAEPARWEELARGLAAQGRRLQARQARRRRRHNLLGKLRYEVGKLREADPGMRSEHWRSLLVTLEEWSALDGPAEAPGLLELLAPVRAELPAGTELSESARRLFGACEPRGLQTRTSAEEH